jgi:hypothetical protein
LTIEQWLTLLNPAIANHAADFVDWGYENMEGLVNSEPKDCQVVFEYSNMEEGHRKLINQELSLLRRSKGERGSSAERSFEVLTEKSLVRDICAVLLRSGGSCSSSMIFHDVYQMSPQNRAAMKAAGGAKLLCSKYRGDLTFVAGRVPGHEKIKLARGNSGSSGGGSGGGDDGGENAKEVNVKHMGATSFSIPISSRDPIQNQSMVSRRLPSARRKAARRRMEEEEEEKEEEKEEEEDEDEEKTRADADLECIVCFDEGLELFRFEPCGHAQVCLECLSSWRRVSASKEAGYTSCPSCRMPIENLPKEHLGWKKPTGLITGVGGAVAGTGAGAGAGTGAGRAAGIRTGSMIKWNCAICEVKDNGDWRCTGCNTTRSLSSETAVSRAQVLAGGAEEAGRPRYHVFCGRLGSVIGEEDVRQFFNQYYGADAVQDMRFKPGSAWVQFGFTVRRAAEMAAECFGSGIICAGTPKEREIWIEKYKDFGLNSRESTPTRPTAAGAAAGTTAVAVPARGGASNSNELNGFIFFCSRETFRECVSKSLFGSPGSNLRRMKETIGADTLLFLYNIQTKKVHGVWKRDGEAKVGHGRLAMID